MELHMTSHPGPGPPDYLIVVASSAGGLAALTVVLGDLPPDLPAAVLVVQHRPSGRPGALERVLDLYSGLPVRQGEDQGCIEPGWVYVAPPDKHLLVGAGARLRLFRGRRVRFNRPAADPLFMTAARYFGAGVIAVVLSGANSDGTRGARLVRARGGQVLVQDPETARVVGMPESAIRAGLADAVVPLGRIAPHLAFMLREAPSREPPRPLRVA